MTALFYLGFRLFNLSYVPFDIFNWMAHLLPGRIVAIGIDLMIDTLRFLRINVADSAKTDQIDSPSSGFDDGLIHPAPAGQ